MTHLALIRHTASDAKTRSDRSGVEAALRYKQLTGGCVTAVCLGDETALSSLREAVSLGCDNALLVLDTASQDSDPSACAILLANAIRTLEYDVIFTSCYAVDADAIQTGFQLAQRLGLPQAGYAESIVPSGQGMVQVKRQFEDRSQMLLLPTPCLISVLPQPNQPMYMTVDNLTRAYAMDIPRLYPAHSFEFVPHVTLLRSEIKKERKRKNVLTVPTEEAISAIMSTMVKNHIL